MPITPCVTTRFQSSPRAVPGTFISSRLLHCEVSILSNWVLGAAKCEDCQDSTRSFKSQLGAGSNLHVPYFSSYYSVSILSENWVLEQLFRSSRLLHLTVSILSRAGAGSSKVRGLPKRHTQFQSSPSAGAGSNLHVPVFLLLIIRFQSSPSLGAGSNRGDDALLQVAKGFNPLPA